METMRGEKPPTKPNNMIDECTYNCFSFGNDGLITVRQQL